VQFAMNGECERSAWVTNLIVSSYKFDCIYMSYIDSKHRKPIMIGNRTTRSITTPAIDLGYGSYNPTDRIIVSCFLLYFIRHI
jgi:hypothetical protein